MVSDDVVSDDVHSSTMWKRSNAYGIPCGPPWQEGHWWDGALARGWRVVGGSRVTLTQVWRGVVIKAT